MARRAVETMLLSGVLSIDHSRRYWTANNGNGARFLPVSPLHSPSILSLSISPTHCSSRHRRRWARPPPAVSYDYHHHQYQINARGRSSISISGFRPKRSATQLPESSCHLLVGYYSLRYGATRAASHAPQIAYRILLAITANNETQREGPLQRRHYINTMVACSLGAHWHMIIYSRKCKVRLTSYYSFPFPNDSSFRVKVTNRVLL